jgi:hypothetical protein
VSKMPIFRATTWVCWRELRNGKIPRRLNTTTAVTYGSTLVEESSLSSAFLTRSRRMDLRCAGSLMWMGDHFFPATALGGKLYIDDRSAG